VFERFTSAAREAVVRAQEVARHFGHDAIGADHLLAGAMAASDTLAATLEPLGITQDAVRREIESRRGHGGVSADQIPFERDAKSALEGSLRAAMGWGHRNIGPEHIFQALMSADTAASEIVSALGVTPAKLLAAGLAVGPVGEPMAPLEARETTRRSRGPVLGFGTAVHDAIAEAMRLAGLQRLEPDAGHLLQALAEVPNGLVAAAFAELGIEPHRVAEVLADLRARPERAP